MNTLKRKLLAAFSLPIPLVVGVGLFFAADAHAPTQGADPRAHSSLAATSASTEPVRAKRTDARVPQCVAGSTPVVGCNGEPTTLAGYRSMFRSVPVNTWGGGDVSISTRLSDGRRLWLYGDTLSVNNGFVHSSALVQDGKDLHVANGGAQILPNDGRNGRYKEIYWVETVEAGPNSTATIVAAPMNVGRGSLFDFHRRSVPSRAAKVKVTENGDVQFVRWLSYVPRPDIGMDGEDVVILGHAHYGYATFVHDIALADGTWLKTSNQNWDDPFENHMLPNGFLDYHDWRPMFASSTTRDAPYWGR